MMMKSYKALHKYADLGDCKGSDTKSTCGKKDNKSTGQTAELLTIKEVASLLTCSSRSVHRLVDTGSMPPPIKLGRLIRWSRRTLLKWIEDDCPPVRKPGIKR